MNWKNEGECFDSICRQISLFYSLKNKIIKTETPSSQASNNSSKPNDEWIIEHVIYNAFRNMLLISENEEKIFCLVAAETDINFLKNLQKLPRFVERLNFE